MEHNYTGGACPSCNIGELEEIQARNIGDFDSKRWECTSQCLNCKKTFDIYSHWTIREKVV